MADRRLSRQDGDQYGLAGEAGAYAEITAAFVKHGWVLILVGAFTPLPYKSLSLLPASSVSA